MPYQFAADRENYADYAGGKVFHSLPGYPAFPVRLVSEMFQRCLAVRAAHGLSGRCTLYDPCCGGAYHLSTLAYGHWDDLEMLIGSDVDEQALTLARRNFALLTLRGLDDRIAEIETLLKQYGKLSHAEALESAQSLRARLRQLTQAHDLQTHLFHADVMRSQTLQEGLDGRRIDIVLTDVPYGQHTTWHIADTARPPVWQMLESLRPLLTPDAIVAVASDKSQKTTHADYRRVAHFQIGKRRIVLSMVR